MSAADDLKDTLNSMKSAVSDEINCRDIYLKYTDKQGAAVIRYHRVWNVDRFLLSTNDAAKKEGGHIAVTTLDAFRSQK